METLTLYPPDSETQLVAEREPQLVRGEALVIAELAFGRLRVGTELTTKEATEKYRGETTIPIETPKVIDGVPEEPVATARGALPEAFNDTDTNFQRVPLDKYLYVVDGFSHHDGIHRLIAGRPGTVGITTVVYDGPDISMDAYNCLEVADARWEYPEKVLQGRVRSLAREAIQYVLTEGILQETLDRYINQPDQRRQFLPSGFSVREHYLDREKHPDIKL